MSDQVEQGKEVATKAGDVGTEAVKETWPNNKLLIAVLPPTIALLIAAGGMWQSNMADRNAAKEAEKARAAEVSKDQEVASKEQDIRLAALLLPRYETLLENVRALQQTADTCLDDIDRESPEYASSCDLTDEYYAALLSMDKALVVSSSERLREAAYSVEDNADDALVISYDLLESESSETANRLADAIKATDESIINLIEELQGLVTLDSE